MEPWEYIQAIVIIGAVILAAYYVTKLVAKTGGGGFRKNTGIKLLGSLTLGKDKSVAIVEIGENAYVLGVSAQHVELLDKLDKAAIDLKKDDPVPVQMSFSTSFKEELNKRFNKSGKNE